MFYTFERNVLLPKYIHKQTINITTKEELIFKWKSALNCLTIVCFRVTVSQEEDQLGLTWKDDFVK